MKSAKKHSFYPVEEVERLLQEIPRGHLSDRVNELILKGLSFEQQQKVVLAYQAYNAELEMVPKRNEVSSSTQFMSKAAFSSEDEVEDYI
jgi:hypothetical protein